MGRGTMNKSELRVVDRETGQPAAADHVASTSTAVSRNLSALAIAVTNARLNYPLGAHARGSLKSAVLSIFGHRDRTPKAAFVEAIRGLNFRIAAGERVALIGHNGSGKSTLLRALAGIYPLASGEMRVVGRIGTLLDIGLGFETESTGRENIYFRGMTLGYSRKQLRAAEKDIVDFADLGEFIDLPMRTYSTGMYVRLGFAVSTHFSPDILLVDEVFGAGDASFSMRAVERMVNIVNNAGIFVIATHEMGLVERVCQRVIWLDRGLVVRDGPPSVVLPEYARYMAGEASLPGEPDAGKTGSQG
jgi:lipopolysaccharide transport system ATP-binding protein